MESKRGSGMESTIFRKIMVAIDGSELVKRAVDLAIEIAKLSEAKLYAVYIIDLESHNSKNHPGAEYKEDNQSCFDHYAFCANICKIVLVYRTFHLKYFKGFEKVLVNRTK